MFAMLILPFAAQNLLASIRGNQAKLQESHERSKVVTRGADMRTLRDAMQVCTPWKTFRNHLQPAGKCCVRDAKQVRTLQLVAACRRQLCGMLCARCAM